jgi:hypothetical protein
MLLNRKGFDQIQEYLIKGLECLNLFIEDHNGDMFGSRKIFMWRAFCLVIEVFVQVRWGAIYRSV